MAILAPNLDRGLLKPSGNSNVAVKWPFWIQIWTWAFWSLLAIAIWLWNGHFGSKFGAGPFEAFWQLQFGCEMAILAPNLDLGLLKPSGNFNLAVKLPFWLQIWTWAFWSPLAIAIWLISCKYNLAVNWQFSLPVATTDLVCWRAPSGCMLFCCGCDEDPGRGVRPTHCANQSFCWRVFAGRVPIAWPARLSIVSVYVLFCTHVIEGQSKRCQRAPARFSIGPR